MKKRNGGRKNIERKKYFIDASSTTFGRLATQIARILQGKNRPQYQPQKDTGGFIMVTNIKKMKFSGKKLQQKVFHRYSGYPGGITTMGIKTMFEKNPEELLRRTVYQMLPDTRLRKNIIKRLTFQDNNLKKSNVTDSENSIRKA